MRLVGHLVEMKNAYKVLVVKPEEKKSLRRARRRWENNVKVDLK
jgi:hypothetical protein